MAGESKWSFWGLLLYAVDGIAAFSTVPLLLATIMGIPEYGRAFGPYQSIAVVFIALILISFLILYATDSVVPGRGRSEYKGKKHQDSMMCHMPVSGMVPGNRDGIREE